MLVVAGIAAVGCGSSDETEGGGATTGGGGSGGGPPLADGCPPGEVTETDGSCRVAGVPADECAPGFTADAQGCTAVLPEAPCEEGKMALPGETACREVSPCGDSAFPDVADSPGTQYVDAAYANDDSDGTEARPWKSIQEGIDAADAGAVVAVAAGTYEPFSIDAAVSVVGRCPSMVEVVGLPDGAAVQVVTGGATLRGMAITGQGFGLASFADVTVDRCWIHDTVHVGVYAGAGSAALTDSLVEDTGEVGCGAEGGGFALERTVVRRIRPNAGGLLGTGVIVQPNAQDEVGALNVASSWIDDTSDHGILVADADATIDATLIRGTKPRASDGTFGRGLAIIDESPDEVAVLMLTRSVLEANHDTGIFVGAAKVVVEGTTIRDTRPLPDGQSGRGIEAQWLPTTGARASVDLRNSIIEDCPDEGLLLLSSDAALAGVVIRGIVGLNGRGVEAQLDEAGQPCVVTIAETLVEQCGRVAVLATGADIQVDRSALRDNGSDALPQRGSGLVVQDDKAIGVRSRGALRDSLLERNRGASVLVNGSEATVERTHILDTQMDAGGTYGRGVLVQDRVETGNVSRLVLLDSTVERSRECGVVVVDSDAEIERVVILDTAPSDVGLLGDGLAVVSLDHPATVRIVASRIEGSARAGIGNFGAAVTVADTTLECNAIPLDGELYSGASFSFADQGGNRCGCAGEEIVCSVVSSMLAAPTAGSR
jgi:hypothetical protein